MAKSHRMHGHHDPVLRLDHLQADTVLQRHRTSKGRRRGQLPIQTHRLVRENLLQPGDLIAE